MHLNLFLESKMHQTLQQLISHHSKVELLSIFESMQLHPPSIEYEMKRHLNEPLANLLGINDPSKLITLFLEEIVLKLKNM